VAGFPKLVADIKTENDFLTPQFGAMGFNLPEVKFLHEIEQNKSSHWKKDQDKYWYSHQQKNENSQPDEQTLPDEQELFLVPLDGSRPTEITNT